ncbi:type IV toxin-antitoxin system AbiEi family antitoxin domain-containing protein [Streptomyces sp. H39-C1]|uniref:type IV toxin-antitoxin system AbiEi family antitoxin domain-containing protein n=1 Tax=Streptomyces sp. H39-C1 TaxID=3004355 RepID=UPI0022B0512B|nr:type IV toxin-antitoxin system AbiEi family antitoxin domain-containing protein [Streptomyces sp. H39-C1]MCZ4103371.1 type IV toxin-antitoxin system AbiEi family antitoxin domain-containing protein [Streptomyces sp. H39-C1]
MDPSEDDSRLGLRLAALPPTFTTAQARGAALSPRDLAALARAGEIDELSRGVYRLATAPETAYLDLLAVCARAPHAVLCGESALALHELIDDIPSAVHIAVARGTHRPVISYPPVVVAQYAAATFSLGVEQFEAAPGETIAVYGAARSVVDAMRLRSRFGEMLALSALGRYVRGSGREGVGELQRIARELGVLSVVRPAVEAVLA